VADALPPFTDRSVFRVLSTPRSFRQPLAALVLALDGLAAWLLSATLFLMSSSVAAIEGRTGNPNSSLAWWALAFFVVGIAAFVAAWLAVRRGNRGRSLGVLVAGVAALAAAAAIWSIVVASPLDVGTLAVAIGILLAQVAAGWALLSSRPAQP
jgi:hypothetical protein